ncbi:MAG: hypothetical protein AABY76_05540, partial [Planctomycetota bacterium]
EFVILRLFRISDLVLRIYRVYWFLMNKNLQKKKFLLSNTIPDATYRKMRVNLMLTFNGGCA